METLIINNIELEVSTEAASLFRHFSKKADTLFFPEFATDLIVKIFAITYIKDIPDYYCGEKIARSNWTHHTANTFFKTCQTLGFLCEFEVEKRHDGAIRDSKGNVYLCAEWEYDTNTIFNDKGEIEKLYNTSKSHSNCDAMLFTYKVDTDFNEFADRVYERWNSFVKKDDNVRLYLLTALMKKDELESINYFYGIRILVFGNKTVEIWEDYE